MERGEFEGFLWRRGMADMEVGDEGGCCGIVCDMALDEGCRLRILIYFSFCADDYEGQTIKVTGQMELDQSK